MSRKLISVLLVLCLVLLPLISSGCYGPCKLSSGVTKWHNEIEADKYTKEIIFLPVFFIAYPITAFIDYFILNIIEYWSTDKPEGPGS